MNVNLVMSPINHVRCYVYIVYRYGGEVKRGQTTLVPSTVVSAKAMDHSWERSQKSSAVRLCRKRPYRASARRILT